MRKTYRLSILGQRQSDAVRRLDAKGEGQASPPADWERGSATNIAFRLQFIFRDTAGQHLVSIRLRSIHRSGAPSNAAAPANPRLAVAKLRLDPRQRRRDVRATKIERAVGRPQHPHDPALGPRKCRRLGWEGSRRRRCAVFRFRHVSQCGPSNQSTTPITAFSNCK